MAANLQLVISAVDKASGTLANVDKKAGGLQNSLKKVGAIGAVAAAAGIGALGVAAVSFIKAAAEEEAGMKRLQAAVEANGGSWKQHGRMIEEVIRQRQKLAFADDELRASLTLLTVETGSVQEAMKRQVVAMDFARGANIDLQTASKLLGKVTDENVSVLGRYGIVVREGADAQEVLRLVQERFAGQSEAFAESTAGKWQRFNNQIDNIKESIGMALLPIVTALASKLSTWLEEHEEDINRIVQAWGAFARSEIFPILERAFAQLQQLIVGIRNTGLIQWIAEHKLALAALGVAVLALVIVLGGPITIMLAIIAAGTLLLAHWDQIRAKVDQLVADFREKFPVLWQIAEFVFSTIKARVEFWINSVRAIIQIVTALIHGDFEGAWAGIKNLVNGFLNLIKADVENILRLIVGVVKSVLPDDLLSRPFDIARNSVKWLIERINDLIDAIKKIPTLGDIFGGIGGAIGSVVPFQAGGIVRKPTVALIGEREPEVVAPLSHLQGLVGGPQFTPTDIATALRSVLEGMAFHMDADGVVRLVSDRMGRQANLYARGG